MLKVNNACKKFGHHIVLDNINLTVNHSNITGLAGPSGSGKSTLLRCIQKLESLDSGSIECNAATGFMFQDFQLFPHMTTLENLIYAPTLHNKKKDHTQHAKKLLSNLGIISKIHFYPHQLSGGQKQRVALARSLMMKTDLLLCDEPTSGLDVATISDVISLLQSVQKMGITMIIASHDLDFLTNIADDIILITAGNIATRINTKSTQDPISYLKNYY